MIPHNAPRHSCVSRADAERERYSRTLGRIADERTAELKREWRRRYPRRALRIVFGMGSESVLIGSEERPLYIHDRDDWHYQGPRGLALGPRERGAHTLQFVADAIADVWAICGDYREACPRDVMVKPRQNQKV
jgi:hypothetical protein